MALEELRYGLLASKVCLLGDKRQFEEHLGSGQFPHLATKLNLFSASPKRPMEQAF